MNASGGLHSEWRCRLGQLVASRTALILAAVLVGLHLIVVASGHVESIYETFGLSRRGMAGGLLWQIFTYALLHGGWIHLGLNVMLWLMVGSRIGHICGSSTLLWVTGFGVLAGGLMHLASSSHLLVGVSGGVVALIVCYCSLSPESKVMVPVRVSAKSLGRGVVIAAGLFWLLDPAAGLPLFSRVGRFLTDVGLGSVFSVSHACHLGGALAGWIYARWLLRPRITRAALMRDRERREGR